MLPTLEIVGLTLYVFGFLLSCTWLLFFTLLHRFSREKGILKPIFSDIVTFTICIFLFSRLFHIIGNWVDEKFILMELVEGNILGFLKLFFIPSNYLFSLFGAVFGFFLTFFIKTWKYKSSDRLKYAEVILWAFLFSSILGYIGAFFGGQIYGTPTDGFYGMAYSHPDSIVKDIAPLFPLALLYIFLTGCIIFLLKYIERRTVLPEGYLAFIGTGMIGIMFFFGEFLSGDRKNMFYDITSQLTFGLLPLGSNQILGLLAIIISLIGMMRLTQKHL